MTADKPPTGPSYFDAMWSASEDPWDQGARFSEQRKYDLTVAALPRPRYRSAFEPGCATGWLTVRMAARVDRLLAMDRHPRAVAVAAARAAAHANVSVRHGQIPDDWPAGGTDLVVLSEVLYYLTEADVAHVLHLAAANSRAGSHLVAVHYRQPVTEHCLLGDEVHALIARHPAWHCIVRHLEEDFVLEVFERA